MRLSNLEEGSYNNTPEPKKMQVTVADKKANTEAWKRYQAGDSRYEFKNPKTESEITEAGGYYTQPVYDMIEKHGYEKVMSELLSKLDADVIQDFLNRAELNEGPFTGVGKMMMKQKLKKHHKKSDLAALSILS